MFRLMSAILGTVMFVTFAMANASPVHLSYLFGPPIEIPLIFVVLTSFFAGMLLPVFGRMVWRVRRIQKDKERRALAKRQEVEILPTRDLLERG